MKNLRILAVLAAIVLAMTLGLKAQVPPDCEDEGCPSWTWFDCLPLDFEYPGTSCTFTVYFEAQLCNGQMNFRLKTISIPDSPECQELITLILPEGLGGISRQLILVDITTMASVEIMKRYFLDQRSQAADPTIYDCNRPDGQKMHFKTITKGGCVKYVRAYRPASPEMGPGVFHWKIARCSDDGCCIIHRYICYDPIDDEVEMTQEPEFIGFVGNCPSLQPIEDPFINYPTPPWIKYSGVLDQCQNQCYIY